MRTGITVFSLDKRVRELEDTVKGLSSESGYLLTKSEDTAETDSFDFTTPFYCNLCEKKMPKILEEYHAHIKHGI